MAEMEAFGIVESDALDATRYLLSKGLIEADSFVDDKVIESDCFKATASGWAHLRLLAERLEYLSAILPTTPMHDETLRDLVYDSMQIEMRTNALSLNRQITLVDGLLSYLTRERTSQLGFVGYQDGRPCGASYLIGKVTTALSHARKQQSLYALQPDLLD
ncbi:MAG: hypothetical protein ACOY7T_12175 [Pseudomonadota bacterium]